MREALCEINRLKDGETELRSCVKVEAVVDFLGSPLLVPRQVSKHGA